jgi:hypothetical protein
MYYTFNFFSFSFAFSFLSLWITQIPRIYQYAAPISPSLEPPKPMIFTSSYELRPCLVAIGQNQPFSIAQVLSSNQEDNEPNVLSSNQEDKEPKVLCSNQEDNELLATLRESFNFLINLGLDLAL